MPNQNSDAIEDELIADVVSTAISLPNFSADNADRFATEVKDLLETRAQSGWSSEEDPYSECVFVFVDFPRKPFVGVPQNIENVTDLPVSGNPVFGKIFFLSVNASNGTCMMLPCEANDVLGWLSDNGLSHRPVLIAYKNTMQFSFRRAVKDERVRYDAIRDTLPVLSPTSLHEALEHFHKNNLVTPTMCESGIWEPKRSSEYVPAKNTEKAIQRLLKTSLGSWFRGLVKVETEDKVPKGRIDVRLLAPPDGDFGLRYWSIIELKVARTFSNTKSGCTPKKIQHSKLVSELVKGVGQANEFTADRAVKEGFLEIYDMRKDKAADLLKLEKVATALDACAVTVHANVRKMYGSSEEARQEGLLPA